MLQFKVHYAADVCVDQSHYLLGREEGFPSPFHPRFLRPSVRCPAQGGSIRSVFGTAAAAASRTQEPHLIALITTSVPDPPSGHYAHNESGLHAKNVVCLKSHSFYFLAPIKSTVLFGDPCGNQNQPSVRERKISCRVGEVPALVFSISSKLRDISQALGRAAAAGQV